MMSYHQYGDSFSGLCPSEGVVVQTFLHKVEDDLREILGVPQHVSLCEEEIENHAHTIGDICRSCECPWSAPYDSWDDFEEDNPRGNENPYADDDISVEDYEAYLRVLEIYIDRNGKLLTAAEEPAKLTAAETGLFDHAIEYSTDYDAEKVRYLKGKIPLQQDICQPIFVNVGEPSPFVKKACRDRNVYMCDYTFPEGDSEMLQAEEAIEKIRRGQTTISRYVAQYWHLCDEGELVQKHGFCSIDLFKRPEHDALPILHIKEDSVYGDICVYEQRADGDFDYQDGTICDPRPFFDWVSKADSDANAYYGYRIPSAALSFDFTRVVRFVPRVHLPNAKMDEHIPHWFLPEAIDLDHVDSDDFICLKPLVDRQRVFIITCTNGEDCYLHTPGGLQSLHCKITNKRDDGAPCVSSFSLAFQYQDGTARFIAARINGLRFPSIPGLLNCILGKILLKDVHGRHSLRISASGLSVGYEPLPTGVLRLIVDEPLTSSNQFHAINDEGVTGVMYGGREVDFVSQDHRVIDMDNKSYGELVPIINRLFPYHDISIDGKVTDEIRAHAYSGCIIRLGIRQSLLWVPRDSNSTKFVKEPNVMFLFLPNNMVQIAGDNSLNVYTSINEAAQTVLRGQTHSDPWYTKINGEDVVLKAVIHVTYMGPSFGHIKNDFLGDLNKALRNKLPFEHPMIQDVSTGRIKIRVLPEIESTSWGRRDGQADGQFVDPPVFRVS